MNTINGFYINLDSKQNRNQEMQAQLSALNLASLYSRFSAIDGRQIDNKHQANMPLGALGCWMSHESIIVNNIGKGQHLHILEDDAILHKDLLLNFNAIPSDLKWDLIYSDVYFNPPPSFYVFFKLAAAMEDYREKKQIVLLDLKGLSFTGTSSYFVNTHNADKIKDLFANGWRHGLTYDLYINKLVQDGRLKSYLFVPFLSTIHSSSRHSSISEGRNNKIDALDLQRQSLYIESDPEEFRQKMRSLNSELTLDPRLEVYLGSLRHVMADQYTTSSTGETFLIRRR